MSKLVQIDSFEGTSKSSITLGSKSSSQSDDDPGSSKITRDLDFYNKLHKIRRDTSNSNSDDDDSNSDNENENDSSTCCSTVSSNTSRGWRKKKNANARKNAVFIGESNCFYWDKETTEWKFLSRGMVEVFLDDTTRAYMTLVAVKNGGKKTKMILAQNLSPQVNLRVSKRSKRVIVWNGSPEIGPENGWNVDKERLTEYAFQFNTKIKAKIFLEKLEKWKKLEEMIVHDDVQAQDVQEDVQNDDPDEDEDEEDAPWAVDDDSTLGRFENGFMSTGELPETQSLVVLTGSRPSSASPSQTSLHHIEYLSSVHSRETKFGHSQTSSDTSVESKCDPACDTLPTLLMEVTLDGDFDCEKCKKKVDKKCPSSSSSSSLESSGSETSEESSGSSSDEDGRRSSEGIVARVSPTDFRNKSLINLMNKFNLKPSADDEEDDIVIEDDEDVNKNQIFGQNPQNLSVSLKNVIGTKETDLNSNEIMNANFAARNSSKVPFSFNLFVPELAEKCQVFIWNPVHRTWTEYFSGRFEFVKMTQISKSLIKMIGAGNDEKETIHELNPSKDIILLEKISKCFVLLYNALDYSNENYFKDTKFSLVIPKHDPESSKVYQNLKPHFDDFKQTQKVSGPRYNVTVFNKKEPENFQPRENDAAETEKEEIVVKKDQEIGQNLEKVQENGQVKAKLEPQLELGFKVKMAFVDFSMSVDYNELLANQKDGKLTLSFDPDVDKHPKLTYQYSSGEGPPMSHFITEDTKFWVSGPNLGTWVSPKFSKVKRVRFLVTFPDGLVLNLFSYAMNTCSEKSSLQEKAQK